MRLKNRRASSNIQDRRGGLYGPSTRRRANSDKQSFDRALASVRASTLRQEHIDNAKALGMSKVLKGMEAPRRATRTSRLPKKGR